MINMPCFSVSQLLLGARQLAAVGTIALLLVMGCKKPVLLFQTLQSLDRVSNKVNRNLNQKKSLFWRQIHS